jgi:hypothetical protein
MIPQSKHWFVLFAGPMAAANVAIPHDALTQQPKPQALPDATLDPAVKQNVDRMLAEGMQTFRYDTFGSEEFWGGSLKLHQAIQGQKFGGVGPRVSPKQALELGLKVDMAAVPKPVAAAIKAGKVDLGDPANTLLLLKANAVVGVTGFFDQGGKTLGAIGIQCALCHSTVDDAFSKGIGRRLDGWPNRDLDVGKIISVAPDLSALTKMLEVDESTVKKVLTSWGKFDAELNLDGKAFRPDGKPAATLNPPAFGLAGVNNHTWTGSWGTVSYWNAYVGNLEMHGKGNFYDPRLDDPAKYPVAARTSADSSGPVRLSVVNGLDLAIGAREPRRNRPARHQRSKASPGRSSGNPGNEDPVLTASRVIAVTSRPND